MIRLALIALGALGLGAILRGGHRCTPTCHHWGAR